MSSGVSIRWLPAADAGQAERIWTALEARLGGAGLACSWLWTGTWLEHYGDVVPHRFAVAEAGGAPCAIALVTAAAAGPLRLRGVRLGTTGEPPGESVFVEYNRVLAEPDRRAAFAAALIAALRREGGWHELGLDGFAPEDAEPFLSAEPGFAIRREVCRTTDLRAVGDDVLRVLRRNTRTMVRRSLRGIGDVNPEWAATPEQARAILEELIALHQARWTSAGEPGAFARPRFAAFHRALVPRLVAADAAILFRARAEAGTVGCVYALIDRGRVLIYQSGFATYADRQVRPGFVAHALCMQACAERGLLEYDFLAGDSIYKRQLSTGERELLWATWRRPDQRWRLVDGAAALKRAARAVRRRAAASRAA